VPCASCTFSWKPKLLVKLRMIEKLLLRGQICQLKHNLGFVLTSAAGLV